VKKSILWALVVGILLVASVFWIDEQLELNPDRLEGAIAKEIPPGTPKSEVLIFVRAHKPVAFDDLGAHVKCRLTGRALNLVYRRDVVITFEFSPDGKLLSHSMTVFQTFL